MENPRWWHVAVSVIAVALAITLIVTDLPFARQVGGVVALAAFVAGWFALGRQAFQSPVAGYALTAITIVTCGVAVGFFAPLAILQCVAYPLIWVISTGLRQAIIANIALSVSVAVGFWFSTADLAQTTITAALSLTFSLALGLWITQISDRSHERQRLIDELTLTQDRLASVSRDAGVASERERLAREIHDTIAQDLTGLVLLAQQAQRELAGGDLPAADARLQLIEENARTALAETRALVAASAPVGLSAGLMDALARLAERFTRETGTPVTVQGDPGAIDRDQEVVLLRCAQEGLANVRKHSHATEVTLVLSATTGDVRLVVRDDGRGFDTTETSTGFGLGGMRERLSLVGGFLDVRSSSSGTVLTASLPRNQS